MMGKGTRASLVLVLVAASFIAQTAYADLREGVKHYREGMYSKAVSSFAQHLVENPKDARAYYNMGNALYRMGKFSEAEKSYATAIALSEDETLKEKAWFNMGNALFRQGKLPEAVQAYRNALKIDPEDKDARKNLAFVEALLKQLKKQVSQTAQRRQEKIQNQRQKTGEREKTSDEKREASAQRAEVKIDREDEKMHGEQKVPREKKKELSREAVEMILDRLRERRPLKKEDKREPVGGYSGPQW